MPQCDAAVSCPWTHRCDACVTGGWCECGVLSWLCCAPILCMVGRVSPDVVHSSVHHPSSDSGRCYLSPRDHYGLSVAVHPLNFCFLATAGPRAVREGF